MVEKAKPTRPVKDDPPQRRSSSEQPDKRAGERQVPTEPPPAPRR